MAKVHPAHVPFFHASPPMDKTGGILPHLFPMGSLMAVKDPSVTPPGTRAVIIDRPIVHNTPVYVGYNVTSHTIVSILCPDGSPNFYKIQTGYNAEEGVYYYRTTFFIMDH